MGNNCRNYRDQRTEIEIVRSVKQSIRNNLLNWDSLNWDSKLILQFVYVSVKLFTNNMDQI